MSQHPLPSRCTARVVVSSEWCSRASTAEAAKSEDDEVLS